jgi:hypothetical protein
MSTNPIETHSYDGKLSFYKDVILKAKTDFTKIGQAIPTFSETIQEVTQFLVDCKEKSSMVTNAKKSLQLLASKQGNYDKSNDVNVEELFPLIWLTVKTAHLRVDDEDISSVERTFVEQLADIQGGHCPEGRTTRMIQLLAFLL